MMKLVYKPNRLVSKAGLLFVVKVMNIGTVDLYGARAWRIQSTQHVQKGCFA